MKRPFVDNLESEKMVDLSLVTPLLSPIVKLLTDVVRGRVKSKQEEIEKIYNSVVKESFQQLETVHQDYTINLSILRQHLVTRSLPPRELIWWLRERGLQHRALREKLRSIDEETRNLEGKFNPEKDNEGNFYWHLHRYVKAVVDYFEKTTSYDEVSFYRDYENQLDKLLWGIQEDQRDQARPQGINYADVVKTIFYETDYVQDMHDILMRISDKVLPEQWQAVVREYKRVRASAGYPN